MHNVELVAPVADRKELELFINSGADAVSIDYTSRNMSWSELESSVDFVHGMNKKIYVAINIVPHNKDFKDVENYVKKLEKINIDAIIITDAGMLMMMKEIVPNIEIHLSDQANITNYVTAKFWHEEGIKRVLVSKELSCDEIAGIRARTPLELDIEVIVHGSMGISHSARPLLSNFISDKSKDDNLLKDLSNRRYNLVEQKRQGEYFPVYEDERGTFFFNPEELCMLDEIPSLIKSGVTSFKIDTRMKDSNYISEVIKAYRIVIDEFYQNPDKCKLSSTLVEQLKKLNSREYTHGFYLYDPSKDCNEE